jgi:AraC family transcriptional regulator
LLRVSAPLIEPCDGRLHPSVGLSYDSFNGRMPHDEHVNDIIFAGEILKIGRWRLPAGHPRYVDSGPTRHYLFVFPRTTGWIQHAGERAFVVDPNVVTFYNQHQEYTRRSISPQGDHSDYYAIQPHVLRQVVAAWDQAAAESHDRIMRLTHGPSDPATYWRQRMVYTQVRHGSADPLFVEETMLAVLTRLMELAYGQQPESTGRRVELVEHAREIIAAHFTSPLTLTALARATGASVFHLCRVFRERTGVTIHAYRNQLRLRTALERAADPSVDLSALALDLGFSTHSHFTSAFKRLYGMTPSDLRRRASARLMSELTGAGNTSRQSW